jgi:endonuclease III
MCEPREVFLKIKKYVEENLDKSELVAEYVWEKYKDPLKLLIAIILSVRSREETQKKLAIAY